MKQPIIQMRFEDGREVTLTAEQLGLAFFEFLSKMYLPSVVAPAERCSICQWGRVGNSYCTCQLGRDLKRVEERMPNPVGSVIEDAGEDLQP